MLKVACGREKRVAVKFISSSLFLDPLSFFLSSIPFNSSLLVDPCLFFLSHIYGFMNQGQNERLPKYLG